MLRAQPPTHRPAWMVVLAATMLLYGGLTLVGGLLMVRDPKAVTRHTIRNVARTPAVDEKVRKLEPILDAVADRHRVGMRDRCGRVDRVRRCSRCTRSRPCCRAIATAGGSRC